MLSLHRIISFVSWIDPQRKTFFHFTCFILSIFVHNKISFLIHRTYFSLGQILEVHFDYSPSSICKRGLPKFLISIFTQNLKKKKKIHFLKQSFFYFFTFWKLKKEKPSNHSLQKFSLSPTSIVEYKTAIYFPFL